MKKELLVFGYIRVNYTKHIPIDIIKICELYIKPQLTWSIPTNEIKSADGKDLKGPIFEIGDATFQCQVSNPYVNELDFEIVLKSLPDKIKDNMDKLLMFYEIYCDDTNSLEKDKAVLTEIGDDTLWRYEEYEAFEHKENITFDVYVDILALTLKDETKLNKLNMCRSIIMNKQINYDWIIDGDLLDIFRNCTSETGKMFYSPNFGLNGNEINGNNFGWTLYCMPNGSRYTRNCVYLGILLLNLPLNIGSIACNVKLKCDYGDIIYQNEKRFYIYGGSNFLLWTQKDQLQPDDLMKMLLLTFSAQIEIKMVYDLNGDEVDTAKWNEYGILSKIN